MLTVLTMAVKDLRILSRDWLGLFFIIAFPILMGVFFGSMYSSMAPESAKLNIAVADQDKSAMSAKFVEALSEAGQVQVERLNRQQATNRVRRGQLVGMVVIPKGFGKTAGLLWMEGPALEVGVDPSRQAESAMLEGMIMKATGRLMMERFQDPQSTRKVIDKAQDDIAASTAVPETMRPTLSNLWDSIDEMLQRWADVQAAHTDHAAERADAAPEFRLARIEKIDVTRELEPGSTEALVRRLRSPWDISFPQSMLWGVMACAATFAATIVRERKQGTLLRLQVAPVSRAQIVAGKAAACFIAVFGVIFAMILLGTALGMRPRSPMLLLLASVSVAFCFVGIMMLMSVVGRTEEAVAGAAWGANMLMAMFGGAMIPLLFMPRFMQTVGQLSPVKWSILSLEGAIWRGFAIREMLVPCGALLVTGAVCLGIGTTVLCRSHD